MTRGFVIEPGALVTVDGVPCAAVAGFQVHHKPDPETGRTVPPPVELSARVGDGPRVRLLRIVGFGTGMALEEVWSFGLVDPKDDKSTYFYRPRAGLEEPGEVFRMPAVDALRLHDLATETERDAWQKGLIGGEGGPTFVLVTRKIPEDPVVEWIRSKLAEV